MHAFLAPFHKGGATSGGPEPATPATGAWSPAKAAPAPPAASPAKESAPSSGSAAKPPASARSSALGIDVDALMTLLRQIRESIPEPYRAARKALPQEEGALNSELLEPRALDGDALIDFEAAVVVDSIESVAAELREAINNMNAKVLQDALKTYYITEELAKEPENAHLIPHVEAMRKAYEASYGEPIPPRPPGMPDTSTAFHDPLDRKPPRK
jgi:hypothetical protein